MPSYQRLSMIRPDCFVGHENLDTSSRTLLLSNDTDFQDTIIDKRRGDVSTRGG
jgi:hypothetical protein